MESNTPAEVDLTPEEKDLVDAIDFAPTSPSPDFHERLRESCRNALPLAKSLLEREAVRGIRLAYFFDPEYNIGVNCSRKEVFERNGTRGEDILGHAHFLPYLRYFIFGPDLPKVVMKRFCQAVADDPFQSSDLLEKLRRMARKAVRDNNLDRHDAAAALHQLSLEVELPLWLARSVRDAMMQMKAHRR